MRSNRQGPDESHLYWGDLHNHNEIGYADGTLERSYEIATATLDFYAFTPPVWWPDLPEHDVAIRDQHRAGFERTAELWGQVIDAANVHTKDGTFVSFISCEWHSSRWGDFCVHFPGEYAEMPRCDSINELKEFVTERGGLLIPHHIAYARGSRGTDWDAIDTRLSPVAEVFSEHGSGHRSRSRHGYWGHSMGGTQTSQTFAAQVAAGRRIGCIAGTDNQFGHPGCYGQGLTAVYAPQLSRSAIFEALRSRHTYGVTGDRIRLAFSLGDAIMGDRVPAGIEHHGVIQVDAVEPIDHVRLVRNGSPIGIWSPGAPDSGHQPAVAWIVRIEWGWGRVASRAVSHWHVDAELESGAIVDHEVCFSSGPDTTGEVNSIEKISSTGASIRSATCRTNSVPTQSVVFWIDGDRSTTLRVAASGDWCDTHFEIETCRTLGQLTDDDLQTPVADDFTAPRLRCRAVQADGRVSFRTDWEVGASDAPAHYYVSVVQENGHEAWSSPIWVEKG